MSNFEVKLNKVSKDIVIERTGVSGKDGRDGLDGVDGQDGIDGLSAYQIALNNGFIGSEVDWLNSLKGQDGVDGQDGTVDTSNFYNKTEINNLLNEKQNSLTSGTNLKTINNQSLLGSGNIDISAGSTYDQFTDNVNNLFGSVTHFNGTQYVRSDAVGLTLSTASGEVSTAQASYFNNTTRTRTQYDRFEFKVNSGQIGRFVNQAICLNKDSGVFTVNYKRAIRFSVVTNDPSVPANINSYRFLVGLSKFNWGLGYNSSLSDANSTNPIIGFGKDISDSNLSLYNVGSGGTNKTDIGVKLIDDHVYVFKIECIYNTNTVKISLYDETTRTYVYAQQTITTNLTDNTNYEMCLQLANYHWMQKNIALIATHLQLTY